MTGSASAVRVLYTDVDGTLVGPGGDLFCADDGSPTLAAAEGLVLARRHGLEIVLLTGRGRHLTADLARLIGADSWIAELGGIRSYDRGAEVILDHGRYEGQTLFDDLWRAATGLMDLDPQRLESHDPWNELREASVLLRGDLDLAAGQAWLDEQGFGWAHLVDNGVIPRRYEGLPGVETVRAYHLAPRGISKREAIVADRARRGLAVEECAVIGDAASDLDCHSEVARCFLVSNALVKDPSLEAAASQAPNVVVTERGHGAGFKETVEALLSL